MKEPYELRRADEERRLRIVGCYGADVAFSRAKASGGAVFEIAENLRKDMQLVIGGS